MEEEGRSARSACASSSHGGGVSFFFFSSSPALYAHMLRMYTHTRTHRQKTTVRGQTETTRTRERERESSHSSTLQAPLSPPQRRTLRLPSSSTRAAAAPHTHLRHLICIEHNASAHATTEAPTSANLRLSGTCPPAHAARLRGAAAPPPVAHASQDDVRPAPVHVPSQPLLLHPPLRPSCWGVAGEQ